ncbi:nucleotide-diphospho-sugar transferase [Candidatus Neomarinimicrobiota bacterium]
MKNSSMFTPPQPLKTAVLFLIFNRLDITRQVFEAIKLAKPPRLYVAADGSRESKRGEDEKTKEVRDYVMCNIDWDCEVKTLFREKNLGCKFAVSGAIDWFFENEEMGIILEDDCLPSQSFFWFCEELLEMYKNDESVYLVSGDNRIPNSLFGKEDYTFIKYSAIWGWASWARVWKDYDVNMISWNDRKNDIVDSVSSNESVKNYWNNTFQKTADGQIDTWDYQLAYLLLSNNAKCIVPKKNMISNIGFGANATHTTITNSISANHKRHELNFPLKHPERTEINNKLNRLYEKYILINKSLIQRIFQKIKWR